MAEPLKKIQETPPVKEGELVSLYEKHKKIYVRSVKGWWSSWRWALVFITQLIFYGAPWLQWNDRQAVLFHVVERKFYLFGLVLWPQDVFYLAILLIISAYALFLFTAVAGRLFCGYACPQTVYTEIFLWFEEKIEGNRQARIKLDKAPLSAEKLKKKILKHLAWIVFSVWTGFTLVGYFTPMSELLAEVPDLSFGSWEWFWIFFYAGFTYMQAGFLREQVCKYMCPYSRFQSVMFDPDTLVITYDPERGEPRGSKRGNKEKLGDCVDCGICVQVCPTGIDIREGLQYECIGCGACIDACDEVMLKVKRPVGLIRYTTENALAKLYSDSDSAKHVFRPRILLYTFILILICLATAWSIANRIPLKVDVIRDRSIMARELDDGKIENVYTLKVMNVSESPRTFSLAVSGLEGVEIIGERQVSLDAAKNQEVMIGVRVNPEDGKKGTNPIYFEIQDMAEPTVKVKEKAAFMLP